MSEESVKIEDLSRRLSRLEDDVLPVPKILAKQHSLSNVLQTHSGQLDFILGPKDSLWSQVSELRSNFKLMRKDIDAIKKTIENTRKDVAKILESHELQKANVVGQWQMRATTATAVIAAVSAVLVALMQFV
jgi:hypothetical protein|tara:strand:- start:442 stop:837 length:396 start_codon:yes stop_codon:yes gene_type:complete